MKFFIKDPTIQSVFYDELTRGSFFVWKQNLDKSFSPACVSKEDIGIKIDNSSWMMLSDGFLHSPMPKLKVFQLKIDEVKFSVIE